MNTENIKLNVLDYIFYGGLIACHRGFRGRISTEEDSDGLILFFTVVALFGLSIFTPIRPIYQSLFGDTLGGEGNTYIFATIITFILFALIYLPKKRYLRVARYMEGETKKDKSTAAYASFLCWFILCFILMVTLM